MADWTGLKLRGDKVSFAQEVSVIKILEEVMRGEATHERAERRLDVLFDAGNIVNRGFCQEWQRSALKFLDYCVAPYRFEIPLANMFRPELDETLDCIFKLAGTPPNLSNPINYLIHELGSNAKRETEEAHLILGLSHPIWTIIVENGCPTSPDDRKAIRARLMRARAGEFDPSVDFSAENGHGGLGLYTIWRIVDNFGGAFNYRFTHNRTYAIVRIPEENIWRCSR
jgi:hypothetical protein